jgi:hypothetical protein
MFGAAGRPDGKMPAQLRFFRIRDQCAESGVLGVKTDKPSAWGQAKGLPDVRRLPVAAAATAATTAVVVLRDLLRVAGGTEGLDFADGLLALRGNGHDDSSLVFSVTCVFAE